jgi:hypothetical protein
MVATRPPERIVPVSSFAVATVAAATGFLLRPQQGAVIPGDDSPAAAAG